MIAASERFASIHDDAISRPTTRRLRRSVPKEERERERERERETGLLVKSPISFCFMEHALSNLGPRTSSFVLNSSSRAKPRVPTSIARGLQGL